MDKDITNGKWSVKTTVDDDGHLTVWVSHEDKSGVQSCELDFDSLDETGWCDRFTTTQIERMYDGIYSSSEQN